MTQKDIEYIEKYINEHINDNTRSIKTAMCAHFNKSQDWIDTCFKEKTGQGFGNYLRKRRLEISKDLIQLGMSLESITFAIGYETYNGYSGAFAREYGLTPREYADQLLLKDALPNPAPPKLEHKHGAKCHGCIHWRIMTGLEGTKACHYSIDTGNLRNCSSEDCPHFNNDRMELAKIRCRTRELAAPWVLDDYFR